jgi:hypothetical protein
LQSFQRRKKQMAAFTRFASAVRDVRVVEVPARPTVPRGRGWPEQRVDRGTLVVGRDGVPQP